jgi:hypothetical protein
MYCVPELDQMPTGRPIVEEQWDCSLAPKNDLSNPCPLCVNCVHRYARGVPVLKLRTLAILTNLTSLPNMRPEDAMSDKSQSRSKGPKVSRHSVSGRYEIVRPPKKSGASETIVTSLAREGVYFTVPKGSDYVSSKVIEKHVRQYYVEKVRARTPARTKATEKPRARLVGAGLTRSGKSDKFPWASEAEIESVVDMADTISSNDIAARLNTNRETISQWRAAGRLIGVEGAKRGVRYPDAQIGKNFAPLPGIDKVLEALGGDHWEAWRFLAGKIDELEGATGFDALRDGRLNDVLEVLEARLHGSFS